MNPVHVLLIAALVVYVLVRRFAGEPLQARRLLLVPVALTVWGGYELTRQLPHHLSTVDVTLLAFEVVVGLAAGAARGITIRIFPRDGYLWYRYQWSTLAVWVVTALLRLGLTAGTRLAGSHLPTSGTLLLMLGVSLLGEAAAVAPRALAAGTPLAPAGTRQGLRTVPVSGRYPRAGRYPED